MSIKAAVGRCAALLMAGFMLCTVSAPRAAVIFDNGAPNHSTGGFSDFDFPNQAADVFSFGSGQTIRTVHWWGFYAYGNTPLALDNFTIRIFTVTAGVPEVGPSILDLNVGPVGRQATGNTIGSFDVYAYWVTIPDLTLAAGDYLISIVNDTASDTDDDWVWLYSATAGTIWSRIVDGDAWGMSSRELAYYLTDDIPEPGTMAIFGLGLVGLGLARRRRAS